MRSGETRERPESNQTGFSVVKPGTFWATTIVTALLGTQAETVDATQTMRHD